MKYLILAIALGSCMGCKNVNKMLNGSPHEPSAAVPLYPATPDVPEGYTVNSQSGGLPSIHMIQLKNLKDNSFVQLYLSNNSYNTEKIPWTFINSCKIAAVDEACYNYEYTITLGYHLRLENTSQYSEYFIWRIEPEN